MQEFDHHYKFLEKTIPKSQKYKEKNSTLRDYPRVIEN